MTLLVKAVAVRCIVATIAILRIYVRTCVEEGKKRSGNRKGRKEKRSKERKRKKRKVGGWKVREGREREGI